MAPAESVEQDSYQADVSELVGSALFWFSLS